MPTFQSLLIPESFFFLRILKIFDLILVIYSYLNKGLKNYIERGIIQIHRYHDCFLLTYKLTGQKQSIIKDNSGKSEDKHDSDSAFRRGSNTVHEIFKVIISRQ